MLAHLPALLAVGAPALASYLRLIPSHWAGAFQMWGLENREAALRLVTGSPGNPARPTSRSRLRPVRESLSRRGRAARAGPAGIEAERLREPVNVDPASCPMPTRRPRHRGVAARSRASDAFEADEVLAAAFGGPLAEAIVAVRESELELFDGATPEEIASASRWAH